MKAWMKSLICIALSLMCLFACVGYAALTSDLNIVGTASAEPVLPDIYISKCDHYSYVGEVKVENLATSGTVLTADISGGGTHSFWITVKNISDIHYVYDCTVDGSQAGIEGVYSGTDITYQVYQIQHGDIVNSKNERIFYVDVTVPQGTVADNYLLNFKFVKRFDHISGDLFPEDMPEQEVGLAQRLSDILNNLYPKVNGKTSRDFLIQDTIKVSWGGSEYPYVGSMDLSENKKNLEALFGDLMKDNGVNFILKNEDLNGDWYNEIALYSTSDTLDSNAPWCGDGVVCVYVTVFTPIIDSWWNIIGYSLVCESVHGYCYEVRYGEDDEAYSFSTDEWREDVGYQIRWNDETGAFDLGEIPDETMSADGTKKYKEDFDSYNTTYILDGEEYGTAPYGRNIKQWLDGMIPPVWEQLG